MKPRAQARGFQKDFMKKILLSLFSVFIISTLYAGTECPGKAVSFSLNQQIDLNGDGVNEKFFMCESSKEKNKTLFRVVDGKTDKIILSVILDINPAEVTDDGWWVSIDYSFKNPFSYLTVKKESAPCGMYIANHFVFYKTKYIGVVETSNNVGCTDWPDIDYTEIRQLDYPGCWIIAHGLKCQDITSDTPAEYKTPCIAVYKKENNLFSPRPDGIISVVEKVISIYAVKDGVLQQVLKDGDKHEKFGNIMERGNAEQESC